MENLEKPKKRGRPKKTSIEEKVEVEQENILECVKQDESPVRFEAEQHEFPFVSEIEEREAMETVREIEGGRCEDHEGVTPVSWTIGGEEGLTETKKYASPPRNKKHAHRDCDGLIEGLKYHYTDSGFVDWRKMVPKEYIVLNKDRMAQQGVDVEILSKEEIEELKAKTGDENLLILLGGYKELARIRGFRKIDSKVVRSEADFAVVKCSVTWIPNFENNWVESKVSAIANANAHNVSGEMFSSYLEPIAENRAFVRAVRSFLNIQIMGEDEVRIIGESSEGKAAEKAAEKENAEKPDASVNGALSKYLKDRDIAFDRLRAGLVKNGFEGADKWKSVKDIPPQKVVIILEKLKRKEREKIAKEKEDSK